MRIHTHDASGAILSTLRVSGREAAEHQIGGDVAGWVDATDTSTRATHYVDGALTERPAIAEIAGGTAPLVIDMADMPEATLVRATNNTGASVETTDPSDPVRLLTGGTYTVEIAPPFPWRGITQEVTVDA